MHNLIEYEGWTIYNFLHCFFFFFVYIFLCITRYVSDQVRSSRPDVFCKPGVLKICAKFIGHHRCWSLFFNKADKLYQKRGSNTDVLLWILRKFLRALFYRTLPVDCFCSVAFSDLLFSLLLFPLKVERTFAMGS